MESTATEPQRDGGSERGPADVHTEGSFPSGPSSQESVPRTNTLGGHRPQTIFNWREQARDDKRDATAADKLPSSTANKKAELAERWRACAIQERTLCGRLAILRCVWLSTPVLKDRWLLLQLSGCRAKFSVWPMNLGQPFSVPRSTYAVQTPIGGGRTF